LLRSDTSGEALDRAVPRYRSLLCLTSTFPAQQRTNLHSHSSNDAGDWEAWY